MVSATPFAVSEREPDAPPMNEPRVPPYVNSDARVAVEVAEVARVPLFPYMTPERAPSFGALVKVFNVPEKVLESPRRVVEATVIEAPRETLVPLMVMLDYLGI